MDTQTPPAAEPVPLLQRIALPFFLFSVALTGLLLASRTFAIPFVTRVSIDGEFHRAETLPLRKAELTAAIVEQEKRRAALLTPLRDGRYESLRKGRSSLSTLSVLREQAERQAAAMSPVAGAIHVQSIRYTPRDRSMEIRGDVRSVGAKSMTLLSQFVSVLERFPGVASVTRPAFVRRESNIVGPHSPFSITLSLP